MDIKADDTVICEQCGCEMEHFEAGASCGWRCPDCGWNVVTTRYDPMTWDRCVYEISLLQGNASDAPTLKAVSKVTGRNYLECKREIETPSEPIFSGMAREVIQKRDILDRASVKYTIMPNFPY